MKFIKTRFEAEPQGIGIDLFWGGGVDPYLELARLGLLQPNVVSEKSLKGIARKIGDMPVYDADAGWYGTTVSGFGIFYNKALIQRLRMKEPKKWSDLTDPKLLGRVGAADPRHSGSIHLMLELILQGMGWDDGWAALTKLMANVKNFPESSSRAVTAVTDGEVLYGLAIDFYAQSQILEHGDEKLGFIYPSDITVINPDAMGLLKGAPNAPAAKRFMDFIMSPVGQRLWLTPKGKKGGPREYDLVRHSVGPSLYQRKNRYKVLKNPFGKEMQQGLMAYDSELGSKRWGILNDLLGTWFIGPHDQWAAAARAGNLSGDLLAPPMSGEELLSLLSSWDDPSVRAKTMTKWEKDVLSRLKKAAP